MIPSKSEKQCSNFLKEKNLINKKSQSYNMVTLPESLSSKVQIDRFFHEIIQVERNHLSLMMTLLLKNIAVFHWCLITNISPQIPWTLHHEKSLLQWTKLLKGFPLPENLLLIWYHQIETSTEVALKILDPYPNMLEKTRSSNKNNCKIQEKAFWSQRQWLKTLASLFQKEKSTYLWII